MVCISQLRACAAVSAACAMFAAAPASAAGNAPPPVSAAAASIDSAIQHEKDRRAAAIAGFAVGGTAILAGAVASGVAEFDNARNRHNGDPSRKNVYVGDAVGLAVGLPIAGISAYLFADAQHKLNGLRRQRLSISYSPATRQPLLQLTFNY